MDQGPTARRVCHTGQMPHSKTNIDFTALDLAQGFAGYTDRGQGLAERPLSGALDKAAGTGSRTRMVRMAPGAETPDAHSHPYWEEIYLIEGDLSVGDGKGGWRELKAPAYACREPGFMHGPVKTRAGCLMVEFSWYP